MAKRNRSRSRSRDRSKSKKRKRHRSESKKKRGTDKHKNARKHSTDTEEKPRISRKQRKDTKRRRRNSSSTSSTSSSSSTSSASSSSSRERRRKEKKKKKHRKKEKKRRKEKERHIEEIDIGPVVMSGPSTSGMQADEKPVDPKANAMRPMTKEEWDKQQNVIRKVYDPETGRERLVKGSGEILEEIVSKDRQRDINKQATRGDGMYYATKLGIQDK